MSLFKQKHFLRIINPGILLENWSLKTTAILLPLILWQCVRGEPGPERVVAVPLEVQLPRHMEITNERPKTVEVTMRGAALSNMWFSQPPSVTISGPRPHIDRVNEIPTEAISINDQRQSGRFFVSLNLKDNPVQVDVVIGPRRKLHTIPNARGR